jgi:hypothetical protein
MQNAPPATKKNNPTDDATSTKTDGPTNTTDMQQLLKPTATT